MDIGRVQAKSVIEIRGYDQFLATGRRQCPANTGRQRSDSGWVLKIVWNMQITEFESIHNWHTGRARPVENGDVRDLSREKRGNYQVTQDGGVIKKMERACQGHPFFTHIEVSSHLSPRCVMTLYYASWGSRALCHMGLNGIVIPIF